ncbi:MAG: hypothetical protein HYZ81_00405 [Nitrospinae bacterium]|nr:hypothetical protein [Nitrospinota bacterium]
MHDERIRFEDLRLPALPICDEPEMYVVLRSIGGDIGDELEAEVGDFEATFFLHLPPGAVLA